MVQRVYTTRGKREMDGYMGWREGKREGEMRTEALEYQANYFAAQGPCS